MSIINCVVRLSISNGDWNGVHVVEKDFEANKKEFWSFVGRRTKGRKGGVEALRND